MATHPGPTAETFGRNGKPGPWLDVVPQEFGPRGAGRPDVGEWPGLNLPERPTMGQAGFNALHACIAAHGRSSAARSAPAALVERL